MANNTLPACDWGKLPRIPKATLPPDPYALPPGAQPFKFERGVHFTPMPSDWGCKRTPPSELKLLFNQRECARQLPKVGQRGLSVKQPFGPIDGLVQLFHGLRIFTALRRQRFAIRALPVVLDRVD